MGGDQTFVKPLGLDCPAFTQLLRPFAKLFTQFDTECQPLSTQAQEDQVLRSSGLSFHDSRRVPGACAHVSVVGRPEVKLLGVLFGLQEQRVNRPQLLWHCLHLLLG
jgi:hypothetical protein